MNLKELTIAGILAAGFIQPGVAEERAGVREDYVKVPMPPGFKVVSTELEGPVFADANGRSLYRWPLKDLRNGDVGEQKGKPTCDDTHYRVNSGLQSPYPPDLELPDADTRPTCEEMWPPVLAAADAKPVGRWTIVTRKDGTKQWAYDEFALYTSRLDRRPGDTIGGTKMGYKFDSGASRQPVGPPPNIPPQFTVHETLSGRMLVMKDGASVYAWDSDAPGKSNCTGTCSRDWAPVLAPETMTPQGEWTIFERTPGIKQWAFRGSPLYTHTTDRRPRSQEGSDVAGWRNVYTQRAPAPPKEFTVQETRVGLVLADARGMTVYTYICSDDAIDQQACDHPDTQQAYRFAICGGNDPDRCVKTFPYVIAAPNAKSDSQAWSVMDIDPKTGKRASPGAAGALHVWAYRDRPVYTFADDRKPGDIGADAWGEFNGWRNGFKAFWLRDDFFANTG